MVSAGRALELDRQPEPAGEWTAQLPDQQAAAQRVRALLDLQRYANEFRLGHRPAACTLRCSFASLGHCGLFGSGGLSDGEDDRRERGQKLLPELIDSLVDVAQCPSRVFSVTSGVWAISGVAEPLRGELGDPPPGGDQGFKAGEQRSPGTSTSRAQLGPDTPREPSHAMPGPAQR